MKKLIYLGFLLCGLISVACQVEKGIAPLSENWDDAVRHIAKECKRLGLKFTMLK